LLFIKDFQRLHILSYVSKTQYKSHKTEKDFPQEAVNIVSA